jgi:para-nitrobenzyl esterase
MPRLPRLLSHRPRAVTALAGTLLVTASLLVGAGGPAAAREGSGDPSIVRVAEGALQGAVSGTGRLFAGIPFAAPPVGELRWRPPAPAQPWTGVRQATWPKNECAQGGTGYSQPSYNEDCLYLNVYTPPASAQGRRLPVMVWIHGGAFTSGAGSAYNATALAQKGDRIVVTINYRLGPLGWLVHPALDAETTDGASGNYGLADQQAALRWVRRNIAAFGGDARNVTIFGESAGGASVCAQLASPAARGLFHRAIAQSGCSTLSRDRATAVRTGTTVAGQLGCTDPATAAACLRATTPQQLLGTSPGGQGLAYAPVHGGTLLPVDIRTALSTGRFNRVPFLHGTNHDEGRFFVRGVPVTEASYRAALDARYGEDAAAIAAEYPVSDYPSPVLALAATITDGTFACPALTINRAVRRYVPTYGYEFNDPNAPVLLPADFPQGAYHAAELQYVFQYTPVLSLVPEFTPEQRALSDAMVGYWTRFAARGTPNGRDAARWPNARSGNVLSLAPAATRPLAMNAFAADHHCGFWNRLDT